MLTFSKHLTKKHMNVRNKKLLGRWNLRELTSHSQLEVCRFFSIAYHGIETLNLEGSGFCFLRNGGGAVFLWGGMERVRSQCWMLQKSGGKLS